MGPKKMSMSATERSLNQLLSERGFQPRYAKDQDPLPECTVVRERFANRLEFILTFIAFVITPVNIWRFPYLVLKNGGAVFVWLYIMVLFLIAAPVSYLELALGQYSGKNAIRVWDHSPAFRGVGFSVTLLCWLATLHFQLFMTRCMLYAVAALGHNTGSGRTCKPEWTNCFADYSELRNWTQKHNLTLCRPGQPVNLTCMCHKDIQEKCYPAPHSAEYINYYEEVLGTRENGVEVTGFGAPLWKEGVLLFCSWAIVTVSMLRGTRYTSKILYVTVTFPFISLLCQFGIGAARPGAIEGLAFVFGGSSSVDWKRLLSSEIWMDAIGQAFFTLNTGLGELFIVGGYMQFRSEHLFRDACIVTGVDILTSLLAAVTIFFMKANHAYEAGPEYRLQDIAEADLGLGFRGFLDGLGHMPAMHLFSTIFFISLYILIIDSLFGLVETIITYLEDDFRKLRRHSIKTRVVFGTVCFLFDLVLACPGGNAIVETIDRAAFTICLPVLALIEVCVIMWGYGAKVFISDLEYMLAKELRYGACLLLSLYAIFLPMTLVMLLLSSMIRGVPELIVGNGGAEAVMVTWVLFPVPVWFFLYSLKVYRTHRHLSWRKIGHKIIQSSPDWGPNDGSNIHRSRHSVFADISDRLKTGNTARTKQTPQEEDFPVPDPVQQSQNWEADHWFESLFVGKETPPGTASATENQQKSRSKSEFCGPELQRRLSEEDKRRSSMV